MTATGALGAVALDLGGRDRQLGVARYNVHRSTTRRLHARRRRTGSRSRRARATPTTASPGDYYYKVVAEDAGGNLGPASNEATATVDRRHDGAVGSAGLPGPVTAARSA